MTYPLELRKTKVTRDAKIMKLFSCSCFSFCTHKKIYAVDSKGTFYLSEKGGDFKRNKDLNGKLGTERLCSTQKGVVSLGKGGTFEFLEEKDVPVENIVQLEALLRRLNKTKEHKLKIVDISMSSKRALLLSDGSAIIVEDAPGLNDSESHTIIMPPQLYGDSEKEPVSTVISAELLKSTKGKKATKIVHYEEVVYENLEENSAHFATVFAVCYDNSKEIKTISLNSGEVEVFKLPDIIQDVKKYYNSLMVNLVNGELWRVKFDNHQGTLVSSRKLGGGDRGALWSRNQTTSAVAYDSGIVEVGELYNTPITDRDDVSKKSRFAPSRLKAKLPHKVVQICTINNHFDQAAVFLMENGEIITAKAPLK